jgi:hypothetical protein
MTTSRVATTSRVGHLPALELAKDRARFAGNGIGAAMIGTLRKRGADDTSWRAAVAVVDRAQEGALVVRSSTHSDGETASSDLIVEIVESALAERGETLFLFFAAGAGGLHLEDYGLQRVNAAFQACV